MPVVCRVLWNHTKKSTAFLLLGGIALTHRSHTSQHLLSHRITFAHLSLISSTSPPLSSSSSSSNTRITMVLHSHTLCSTSPPSQPAHKTLKTKKVLAKKQNQNRPIPQWIRLRTDNTIRLGIMVHRSYSFQVQCEAKTLAPNETWNLEFS